jgi:hypothetical protein
MERERLDEVVACSCCGGTVDLGPDLAYEFGEDQVVCFECALRAGGRYDAATERWTKPPAIEGLREDL